MGANRSVVGCVFLMFVDGGQRPLNEECEAAPVSGERGRGGRNRSVEECALREGKADGFIRLKLLAVMKSRVCSLEINIWSKNM